MTEPLEGAMLPHEAAAEAEAQRADEPTPPTWPDLAYWRETALQQADDIAALKRERDALRMELEIARLVILATRPPTDSTRAAMAQPFPARALRTYSDPEIWR